MKANDNHIPTIMTIFGGSGDLTSRKLIPALYNLFLDGQMPEKFAIVGLGRTNYSEEEYVKTLKDGIQKFSRQGKNDEAAWDKFSNAIRYLKFDISDPEAFNKLAGELSNIEQIWETTANQIFYLSIAPELIESVANGLDNSGICKNINRSRIVIEKPFGHDLESAKKLNKLLCGIFDESQIYRIDHYLGKEAVQNLLVFRFANALFEPVWNRNYIEHIQITTSESIGVEDRGGYYDGSGALRDMIQNHMLQVLCFTAMEAPISFEADEIRNRKLDVLRAIRRYEGREIFKHSARGQYGEGWVKGSQVPAYRNEVKVNPKSNTETFAGLRLYIDNWRWQGVPFYIRSGKRMPEKKTAVTIQFRQVPHQIFPKIMVENLQANRITINIAPETGINIGFQTKKVGLDMALSHADLHFDYSQLYESEQPEAYETLLHDIMTGDATLFMRSDEVEEAWRVVMPFLEAWAHNPPAEFPNYAANSWGPESAERMIAEDGFHWINKIR